MRSEDFSEGESDSDSQLLSFANYHYKGQSIYEDSPQSIDATTSIETVLRRFPLQCIFQNGELFDRAAFLFPVRYDYVVGVAWSFDA